MLVQALYTEYEFAASPFDSPKIMAKAMRAAMKAMRAKKAVAKAAKATRRAMRAK